MFLATRSGEYRAAIARSLPRHSVFKTTRSLYPLLVAMQRKETGGVSPAPLLVRSMARACPPADHAAGQRCGARGAGITASESRKAGSARRGNRRGQSPDPPLLRHADTSCLGDRRGSKGWVGAARSSLAPRRRPHFAACGWAAAERSSADARSVGARCFYSQFSRRPVRSPEAKRRVTDAACTGPQMANCRSALRLLRVFSGLRRNGYTEGGGPVMHACCISANHENRSDWPAIGRGALPPESATTSTTDG